MSYIGNSPGVASQRVETAFTATASQTVFTPSSGYTLGYCDVYYNGVKLVNGDDYTAADGVSITLATAAAAGDSVVVVASFPRGLTDGYLKAEADAKYVALTGDQTIAGVKTFSGSATIVNGNLGVGTSSVLGNSTFNAALGIAVRNQSTSMGYFQTYNANAGTDLKTWRFGGNGSGNLVFETVNDAYSSATGRLTLDSNGQVGIGAPAPGAPLHILSGTQEQLRLGRTATGSSGYITFFANNSSSAQVQYAGILGDVVSSTAGSHSGQLLFYTTNAGTSAEQARLTNGGNFKLNGGAFETVSGNGHSLRFYQNSTNYSNGAASWAIFGGYSDGTMYITRYGGNPVNQTPADIVEIKGNGDVKVNTGNLVIGTAGKGIDFSASPNTGGATGELLDDYEHGTWTPSINLLGTLTYGNRFGKYQKIGKFVHVSLSFSVYSSDTTQDGSPMQITGLPFTSSSDGSNYANGAFLLATEAMRGAQVPTAQNTFFGLVDAGATTVSVVQNNYNATISGKSWYGGNRRDGYIGGTMYVLCQFRYEVA